MNTPKMSKLEPFGTMEDWKKRRISCPKCGSDDDWTTEYECLECGYKAKFKVMTATIGDPEDCWTEDGKPWRFNTVAEAQAEIDQFILDQHQAVDDGDMSDKYDKDDYTIVPE